MVCNKCNRLMHRISKDLFSCDCGHYIVTNPLPESLIENYTDMWRWKQKSYRKIKRKAPSNQPGAFGISGNQP